jgi:predicted GNAT superfamily acetyltransferase
VYVSQLIPEFKHPYDVLEYQKRFENVNHLILISKYNNELTGFKVGYELSNTSFYSWMGGVVPKFRKMGIAGKLALVQQKWAKENNYKEISLKTRNARKEMLLLSIKDGFQIKEVQQKENIEENRIVLKKKIY